MVLSAEAKSETATPQPLKSAKTCNDELKTARSALADAGLSVREFIHACWNAHDGSPTHVGALSISLDKAHVAPGTPVRAAAPAVAVAPPPIAPPAVVADVKPPVAPAPPPSAAPAAAPTPPPLVVPPAAPKPPRSTAASSEPPAAKTETNTKAEPPKVHETRTFEPLRPPPARRTSRAVIALIARPEQARPPRAAHRPAARLLRDRPGTRLVATVPRGLPQPPAARIEPRHVAAVRPPSTAGMKLCWMNGSFCQTSNVESTARTLAPGSYQLMPASQKPNGL